MNQGVGGFNIIVDDVVGQHTSLALRQEEQRQLLSLSIVVESSLRVVNVKDAASKSRSHLTSVVAIHSEGASLGKCHVSVGEFTQTSSGEDRGIGSLEALVNNETSIIHQSIVVDTLEDILVHVFMATGHQDSTSNFLLILFTLLLLLLVAVAFTIHS